MGWPSGTRSINWGPALLSAAYSTFTLISLFILLSNSTS